MRRRRGFVLAAFLVAGAFFPSAATTQERVGVDSLEISDVTFPGATAYPRRFLETAVATQPSRCTAIAPLCWLGVGVDRQYLDPRILPQDELRLRFFYAQQGYREANVTADTTRDGEKMRVAFHIEEGRPILVDSITVSGLDSLPAAIARNLPLQAGDPLSVTQFEATRDTITSRLHNRGYANAIVLGGYTVLKGEYGAAVRFDAYPDVRARIGEIEVVGAERVDHAVVRRMLTFEPGDFYTRTALLESQRNLFAQDVFRHAEIQDFPIEGDTLVDVRVQVNEGDLHRVRTGLGLSSAEYLNAEVRWVSRNFFGGARRLELRGAITNLFANSLEGLPVFDPTDAFYGRLAGSASADFTQPWFFGPRNSFGSGVFLERQSFPDVFVRTSGGGYVSLSRSLTNGSFSAAFRPELTKLATAGGDLIFCIGFTACGPDEVQALSQANWLAPISLSYARDMSNSLFAPTRGYTLRLDAELATAMTGSDFSYYRLSADLIDYHTFRPGWVWALRISPGYAHAITDGRADLGVHPQKRFFAGGANTVRGFAQYRLGPKVLTIDATDQLVMPADSGGAGCTAQSINDGTCDARALADRRPGDFEPRPIGGSIALVGNAEIRFPITPARLQGALFLDYGQVWETQQAVRGSDIVWTPGLGVRYFSPIGPIRIDVGYYGGRGETRSVVTTTVCPVETVDDDECMLDPDVVYDRSMLRNTDVLQALDRQVLWNPRRSFFDRLQFHFSIGQAF